MRGAVIAVALVLGAAGGALIQLWAVEAHRPAATTPAHAVAPPQERVDINHASLAELMKVPGLTGAWAGRIVRFRPYRAKTDLLENGVLPSDVYDRIKDYVVAHRDKK